MQKDDLLKLISNFDKEVWKYEFSDELNEAMNYVYLLEDKINKADDKELIEIYNEIKVMIEIIRLKYGIESELINMNPELGNLKQMISTISLKNIDYDKVNMINDMFNKWIIANNDISFLVNKYSGIHGKEGLYLTIESLKSLISNDKYKKLLNDSQIKEIYIDCVKLNKNENYLSLVNKKYKELIGKIWQNSLNNSISNNENFKILFSTINGLNLSEQAIALINRPEQTSCSLLSNNLFATYGNELKRIGFIYPKDSEIIMASAYDLNSNVFDSGSKNKEMGSVICTPEVLEKNCLDRIGSGKDNATCYSEVLIKQSKPCGIVVLGLGENDLNIYDGEACMLAKRMNLPIYHIDELNYKKELSENNKIYIAFHSIMRWWQHYVDNNAEVQSMVLPIKKVYELIDIYKEQIAKVFLDLKSNGNLSKETMSLVLDNMIDVSLDINKSRV